MKSILTVIAAVLVINGKGAANDTGGMEKIIPKIEFTGADSVQLQRNGGLHGFLVCVGLLNLPHG